MTQSSSRRRIAKSLITGMGATLILAGGFQWIQSQEREGELPWLLRANHRFQETIWSVLSRSKAEPPRPGPQADREPRVNGLIGLETPIELKSWRLRVYVEDQLVHTLPIESLRALERTSTSSEFYCIEGWSAPISYAGVRFSEFIKTYALNPEAYRYVALETPDGEYYVSVDMPSMLHEQTLLAYEMNEKTLKPENGFPLRLIIPIKYGIKSLKRIGAIRLSNTRPKDYWAEQGYDWYSGL